MARAYSHTVWWVKPGREAEFVERWQEMSEWSGGQGLGGAELLHDADDPRCFISFGPWESVDTIRRWRGLEGFHERVARLQEVVESFEPRTLSIVIGR